MREMPRLPSRAVVEPTRADDGVARSDHLHESNVVAAQLRAPCPLEDQLPQETHHQHSRGINRWKADSPGVQLIDMDRVEISGGARVAHQLDPVDRRLRQCRQLIADSESLEV